MRGGRRAAVFAAMGGLLVWAAGNAVAAEAIPSDDAMLAAIKETDRPAPIDYGYGPGVRPPASRLATAAATLAAPAPSAAVAPAAPGAHLTGVFGPVFQRRLIPIHTVLLPDGRVMSYGSSETGAQGGFVYEVWDPRKGTGLDAHTLLPNGTTTDIFCSGQSVMTSTGEVLITGGDLTIAGKRNYSTQDVTVFSPATDTLRTAPAMAFPRWYPTVVSLPWPEKLVLGGRQNAEPTVTAPIPEIYNPTSGWRSLPGAANEEAYGTGGWYYPRAFAAKARRVFVLGRQAMFLVDPAGSGSITRYGQVVPPGPATLPALMYAAGKIMSVRVNKQVILVDINGSEPVVTRTAAMDQDRFWSNLTSLADGSVLIDGGSAVANTTTGVALTARLWRPETGVWTTAATASKYRLYHATSMLLPDATVITGGGGAPGPARQLNAEIYYPPYLYKKDGSGAAPRPTITEAPTAAKIAQPFQIKVGAGQTIGRVTFVRAGSVTHAFNADQRFFRLAFTQAAETLTVTPPANPNFALPGWYMLFVFDQQGVPSLARIVRLTVT